MQAGYVYIVHGIDTPYIKIGKTTNLPRRMKEIGAGVPFAIRLLSTELVYDMDSAEAAYKERYAAFRTRGEWFALSAEALAQWPPVPRNKKKRATLTIVRSPASLEERMPQLIDLQARIVRLVEDHHSVTVRQLQRQLRLRADDLTTLLTTLMNEEKIVMTRMGKSMIVSRVESA